MSAPVTVTLKPCPFCGGDNVKVFGPYGWYRHYGISHSCRSFYNGAHEMAQGFHSEAQAITAWNTRATEASAARGAALVEALERIRDCTTKHGAATEGDAPRVTLANLEPLGWDWLAGMVEGMCDEDPSDIAYSADQMVDAFIAGCCHRLQAEAASAAREAALVEALEEQVDECFDDRCEMCARHEALIRLAKSRTDAEVG